MDKRSGPPIRLNINLALWIVAGVILALLLGLVDYLTGYELSFSLFYLAPITLVTWYAGRAPGAALAAYIRQSTYIISVVQSKSVQFLRNSWR